MVSSSWREADTGRRALLPRTRGRGGDDMVAVAAVRHTATAEVNGMATGDRVSR